MKIYRRADGRFCTQIELPPDELGARRRTYVYGKTRRDVALKAAQRQAEVEAGDLPRAARDRTRLGGYLDAWLDHVVRPNRRASTHADYAMIVWTQIAPHLGTMRLDAIKPATISALYGKLLAAGVGARTRRKVHAVLHAAFENAVRTELVRRNPVAPVEPPRYVAPKRRPWSLEAVEAFLAAAVGDPLEALYVLAIFTGAREAELFDLRWSDVDLDGAAIFVRGTKTEGSRRRIDLPAIAVESLRAHRKRALAGAAPRSELVFPNERGKRLSRHNLLPRSFRPLIERAGVRTITFHDLRHTQASALLAAGVHPKVVQERLGHARIGTTLDTYSHLIPTMQAEAASVLDRLIPRRAMAVNAAVRDETGARGRGRKRRKTQD